MALMISGGWGGVGRSGNKTEKLGPILVCSVVLESVFLLFKIGITGLL